MNTKQEKGENIFSFLPWSKKLSTMKKMKRKSERRREVLIPKWLRIKRLAQPNNSHVKPQ